jgi:acetoin utilization protein AcuB
MGFGAEGAPMEERRVELWMSHDVLTLKPDATVADAIDIMERERIRHVPIVDERGRLCGIVSDRDVKRAVPRSRTASSSLLGKEGTRKLSDIMTKNVFRLEPGATLREAAELMCQEKISALPVCDGDRLLGIVTSEDLLWAYVELDREYEDELEEEGEEPELPPDREAA